MYDNYKYKIFLLKILLIIRFVLIWCYFVVSNTVVPLKFRFCDQIPFLNHRKSRQIIISLNTTQNLVVLIFIKKNGNYNNKTS